MNEDDKQNIESENIESSGEKAGYQDEEIQNVHEPLKRELSEPIEGSKNIPMILIYLMMILCLWVGFYFNHTAPGGVRWDLFDPGYDISGASSGPKVYDPIKKGKKVFNNCVACHQASGAGLPGVYPPLAGSDWIGKSPDILARIVLNGLSGEIEVNGATYNNAMTPFANLDDKKIAEVLSYVRNSWGNNYPIVTEEEVAAIRASVGSRSAPFTAAELLEMFPD